MQIDPCTSVWSRNREGEFVPLWFNGQQFPDELMKPAKQKAPVTQNPVCNEEKPCPPPSPTPPPHHHHHKHRTHNDFQHLLEIHVESWYKIG